MSFFAMCMGIVARNRWTSAFVTLALAAYVGVGIHTQAAHLATKPLPAFLMEDYGCYVRALARIRGGQDPYADHTTNTGYLYPPQALLLVAALETIDSLAVKFAVFATLSLCGLGATVAFVLRRTGAALTERRVLVAVIVAFAFAPVGWTLYLGQVNLIVAFLIAAGFFLGDRHPVLAGMAIACGTALKITPVLVLVMFLGRRHARLHGAFGLTSVALAGLAGAMFGIQHFATYLDTAREMSHVFPLGLGGTLTLVNTLFLSAGKLGLPMAGWYSQAQAAYSALMLTAFLVAAWRTRDGQYRQLFFALVSIGLTALPNILWYHHFVFALGGLLVTLLSEESPPWLRTLTWVAFGVLQSDRLLEPKLDKLLGTPLLLVVGVGVFVALMQATRSNPVLAPSTA